MQPDNRPFRRGGLAPGFLRLRGLAGAFGLALDRQGDLVIVLANIVGVDVDLDVDRRLLLLRRQ